MGRKHSRRRIRGAGPTEDAKLAQVRALAEKVKANVDKKWATGASPQELSKSVATYEKVLSLLLDAKHAKVVADGNDAINALKAQQGVAGRRRKTRRTRKVKRGGFVPEGGKAFITHAPFPPPDNSFSDFVGTPENSDNSFLLHPSGKKGGKRRRSVKRK